MDESAVIQVERLTRSYGGRRGYDAVRGIDFAVRRGELFALLGTNGAGKTSTLEVLEGLTQPTSGTVRVFGQDPYRDRRTVRPRVGIMLQDRGFAADLTVAETTRMWTGTLSTPRPVGEILELVELTARANVRVRQLSGGERQRLGLGLAIAGRPELLFLDEPTAGLDPENRQNAWQLISRLLESGTTVLLTTHYLAEAAELADRLAILHRGRIVALGTPAEIAGIRPARISFRLPGGAALPGLPQAVATVNESGKVAVDTEDLQSTLTLLLSWATRHELRLEELTARPASLEEAFLTIAESDQGAVA
ncbi:ABC transporter ATP-binding protein [Kribbella sp. CA-293567]|uniref:ABC transporter ATP-binding protein n=1 Tax=Kribbella sp. CA-293567 TaxID=3002436 RepID=UPI0022DDF25D|nr:ABC transporter ATP-binding protein [Kribbella sp. CA-293567]WBQ06235.1 ABC transporter ATP-binding protein [Kribbella sp. CA-293567]